MQYLSFLILLCTTVIAQSLEPRLYSNAPVGMNFLLAGYIFTKGSLPDSQKLDLRDADLNVHTGVFAYARVIELFGQSGKIDMIVPSGCINGDGIYKEEKVSRNVCGIGDIKGRMSFNFYGAPALSLHEFANYEQDLIIGGSLQITIPSGKYEETRLVNIGLNRWALKPSLGISKTFNKMTVELVGDVEFYGDNDEFYGGVKREQDPIFSTQAHFIYAFSNGIWLGLDANYYWGGENSINAVASNDEIEDSRYGATLAIPIDKKHSIKLYGDSGINMETGTDFDRIGIAWQYRFGAGL